MISKIYNWSLFIVFLTISTVYSNEGTQKPHDLDLPPAITNKTLRNHNITKSQLNSQTYYNVTTINDDKVFNQYWIDLKSNLDANVYNMLTNSRRRAAIITQKFQFPFYGHLIDYITIGTGGFLHVGNYDNSWFADIQYIAPLMANFNLSTSNNSNIYYMNNDTAFTVTWHNVILQDEPKVEGFTFQTTFYPNGNIVFAYKHLPIQIEEIRSSKLPVTVGLSDVYVMGKMISRAPTYYQRHSIRFNEDAVSNNTVIILTALPTCLERKNCTSCIKKNNNLQCYWCGNRCYSEIDQSGYKKVCEKLNLDSDDMCASETETNTPEKLIDSHKYAYYNSTIINDDKTFDQYWVDLTSHPDAYVHRIIELSDSHRRAATLKRLKLKFQFPFFGHLTNSISISTDGFLYPRGYINFLLSEQYIAPLMANFDLSTSNDSNIYYMNNDTAFTVTWHNVTLQDEPKVEGFTFQTTLYSNGNIVFLYKQFPIKIAEMGSLNHPVTIGLSDAYRLDKDAHLINVYKIRHETIYQYFKKMSREDDISNYTVIILTAWPTCLERKNCTSCIKEDNSSQCYWCDNQCSSGIYRNSQNWYNKDCEKSRINPDDICASEDPIFSATNIDNSSTEKLVKTESRNL